AVENSGGDEEAVYKLHVLIVVAFGIVDNAELFTGEIEDIELASVPVACDEVVACYREAADVVRDGKLSFDSERVFIDFFEDGCAVRLVLGDGNPDGIA